MTGKWRIKRGDEVIVTSGKNKGLSGKIMRVDKLKERVAIQGVNVVKRHLKPSAANPEGLITKEATIHRSNVAYLDPKTKSATRLGYKIDKDGSKKRFCKKSGDLITE